MRKVYNCFRCGKWFEEAKTTKYGTIWEIEICPFYKGRVYRVKGVRRGLVCLWWWLKRLLVSKSVTFDCPAVKRLSRRARKSRLKGS